MKSEIFLPEILKKYQIFEIGTLMIDELARTRHEGTVKQVEGLYDFRKEEYNAEYILKIVSDGLLNKLLVSEENKVALSLLAANLMNLKGTAKGLKFMLAFLGLDATFYPWYVINANSTQYGYDTKIDPCTVVIVIRLPLNSVGAETIEETIKRVALDFFWVCLKFEFSFVRFVVEEPIIPVDRMEIDKVYEIISAYDLVQVCGLKKYGTSTQTGYKYGEFAFTDVDPIKFAKLVQHLILPEEEWRFGNFNGTSGVAPVIFGPSTDRDNYDAGCRGLWGVYPSDRWNVDYDKVTSIEDSYCRARVQFGNFVFKLPPGQTRYGDYRTLIGYSVGVLIEETGEADINLVLGEREACGLFEMHENPVIDVLMEAGQSVGFNDGNYEPALVEYGTMGVGFLSGNYIDAVVETGEGDEAGYVVVGFSGGEYLEVSVSSSASDESLQSVGFLSGVYTATIIGASGSDSGLTSAGFLDGSYILKVKDTSQAEAGNQSVGFQSGSYNLV